MFSNRKTSFVMSSPYLAWAIIFIVVPIAMVFFYGLTDTTGVFTLANITAIKQPEHLKSLWLALELSVISTVICFLLAYPLGMILAGNKMSSEGILTTLFILPIYNSLAKIDESVINAAQDLGANKLQTFWRVTLPLTIPGIISGVTMVFIPALTTFAISTMMGGSKILLIGNIIEQEFTLAYDWHLGSGLSLILMVFIIINMVVSMISEQKEE